MRKITFVFTAAVAIFALTGITAMACGEPAKTTSASVEKTETTTLSGTLVCMGCDLKKAEGARSACAAYGHKHALKTSDGRYISFLENKYSDALLNGDKYHNQNVKVSGVMFANSNTMDVDGFSVDGKSFGWCGGCKTMDGCGAKKMSDM